MNQGPPGDEDALENAWEREPKRMSGWTDEQLRDDLMLELVGDAYGLWELPGAHLGAYGGKYDALARRIQTILRDMAHRGWVDVFERAVSYLPENEAQYGDEIQLQREQGFAILANDEHWRYEDIIDAPRRYFVYSGPSARSEWEADARRRGLLR